MEKEKKTRMTIAKVFALHANSIKSVMLKDPRAKTKRIKETTKKMQRKSRKQKENTMIMRKIQV